MSSNIAPLVINQIPEHLRGDSPLFVEFLKTYYEYAQGRTRASGLVNYLKDDVDIDSTLDEYISKFYGIYGEYVPQETMLDKRNLVKLLNDIYDAKGTEKAFRLLFRVFYGIEINVLYPSEQILRASDGVWEIFNFITLSRVSGAVPVSGEITLEYTNTSGVYVIDVVRVENITDGVVRFYYSNKLNITIGQNQIVKIRNSDAEVVYTGEVKRSVSNIRVIFPGKFWQVGQIVNISGDTKNTIARVTKLDADGGISRLEIIDHGYGNDDNLVTIISPFPNRPFGNIVDTQANIVSYSPLVYHHVLNITDYIDGLSESIIGTSTDFGTATYFLEDYVSAGYNAAEIFRKSEIVSSIREDTPSGPPSDVSIENWLLSRATLINESSFIGKTRGKYKTDAGQLSNINIRLQDNYYYQAFSYVIESVKNNSEYRGVIDIAHPAGTKLFSNLVKTIDYTSDITYTRTMTIT